jgi:hypothetical protein
MNYRRSLNEGDVAEPAAYRSFGLLHDVRSTPNTDLCIYTRSLAGQGGLQTKCLTACSSVLLYKPVVPQLL